MRVNILNTYWQVNRLAPPTFRKLTAAAFKHRFMGGLAEPVSLIYNLVNLGRKATGLLKGMLAFIQV